MIFQTNRLIIRKFILSDLDAFFTMQSDPRVMQYIKPPLSYEESKKELSLFISYYSDPNKFYNLWAVINTANHQLIGLCGVYENKQTEYEIAYRLVPETWGKGFGNEIAEGLINHCNTELKLKSIVAYVESENKGSCKILENQMNFVEEKIFKSTGIMSKKYRLNIGSYN